MPGRTYSPLQRGEVPLVLSTAERRGTPVLLSASVSDNSGNSPQMAALRSSREIDQSTQHFHVDCDNRCLLGNEYGGLHGREFLGRTSMILILRKSSSFCNIVCGKDTSIGAANLFLMLNHADVIGDQSDAVIQNAWFLWVLCAAISGEISILIQTGAESWGRFPVLRICHWERTRPNYAIQFVVGKEKLFQYKKVSFYNVCSEL